MNGNKYSKAPLSARLLITMILIGIAMTYAVLLSNIYLDTEFKVSLIEEAYSSFDLVELLEHSHRYFPYYLIYIFAFPLYVFVTGTSYSEKLKIFFSIIPICLIIMDIGYMWAIRYIHSGIFSWMLFFTGILLGANFIAVSSLILYEYWLKEKVK